MDTLQLRNVLKFNYESQPDITITHCSHIIIPLFLVTKMAT